MKQTTLFEIPVNNKDIVYTPENIVIDIIKWVNPKGKILDPCMGNGEFFKHLPEPKDWCEIRLGKDFFDYNEKVDFIIGNPPYSIFDKFLLHSFDIAENVVYLVPTNKVFQRKIIMKMINNYDGIKGIRIYGSGKNIGFPFGFSVGAFYFKKDYRDKCELIFNI